MRTNCPTGSLPETGLNQQHLTLSRNPNPNHRVPANQEKTMIKKIALATAIAITAIYSTGCAVVRDQQTVGSYVDDATITTQVKARFADDPKVSAMAIQVETLKGTVQLSGFAKSASERANAEAIAKNVPGVKSVLNSISVRP